MKHTDKYVIFFDKIILNNAYLVYSTIFMREENMIQNKRRINEDNYIHIMDEDIEIYLVCTTIICDNKILCPEPNDE